MPRLLLLGVSVLLLAALLGPAAEPGPAGKPFGIEQRIPWTTSHVVGSPDPPLPYRVRRTFAKLKVPCPIAIAHEPGTENLLLIHQAFPWGGAGRVLRIKDDPDVSEAEELLKFDGIAYGMAFHPDFATNGYLYVGWNGPLDGPKRFTRVTRYTIDRKPPCALDPKSAQLIIEWESDGHNGGDLAFGRDGMLYVSSGDGTSDSDTNLAGQDLTRLLSKVLRLDVDHPAPGMAYAVPPDNPFVGQEGVRPETWAYGFRNPWRLHIDRQTGDLWVGQNGQDLWEQAFLVQRGANYGWSVMEGSHPFYPNRKAGPTPISPPTVEHPHSEMRSLTGGVVYHGERLPELRGAYLYGDWSTGRIWGVKHQGGKVTWHQELARTTMQITGFGLDAHGELLICDHGGGAVYRLEPTPRDEKPPQFPTRLSATGLFRSVKDHQPEPALIAYSVNSPLWSDGAEKERFLAMPGTSQIDFKTSRGWELPDGSVLVKTFFLNTADGKEGSRRRIETRLLTRQDGQWAGYSYLWNDEQTDAELVGAAGVDKPYEVRDAAAPGGRRTQTWHYPSRVECMVCHSRAANWVLGLTTLQMNKVHDYGRVADNQLRTLEHLGVFHIPYTDHMSESRQRLEGTAGVLPAVAGPSLGGVGRALAVALGPLQRGLNRPLDQLEERLRDEPRYTTLLPRRADEYEQLVNPYDRTADLEARARSYLHANCAQCHVMAGGGNAAIELEFTTERDKMNLFGVKPLHDPLGIKDAQLIAPGEPERSVLLQRVARRGAGQMPPLATTEVDREAVQMLTEWIKQMK
jgi:glucose/arabinose dehydrogenase